MKKGETPAQNKINKKEFESLCGIQCTQEEICNFFDVDDKTLTLWCKKNYKKSFSEIFKVKRGIGRISLRRTQWQLAQKDKTMAIWLGKQYLGQRDNMEVAVQDMSKVDELLKGIENEANK